MTTRKKYRDDVLVHEFNEGKPLAFKAIFDLYYGQIFYFTRRLTGDEEAADITSMTFSKLFNLHKNFDSQSNIRAFLYITSRNACFNYLKSKKTKEKNRKEYVSEVEIPIEDQSDFEIKMEEELKAAFIRRIYESIEELPRRRRRVLELFLEGFNPTDIAKLLNISIYSVNNHKAHAIRDLKNLVRERGIDLTLALLILGLQ